MPAKFDRDGIQFLYPENWRLETSDSDSGWTVSLQSPDTAFLMLSFDESMPDPEAMASTALEALKAEYPDLESQETVGSVAGQPAIGHDVQFFSLDLTNTSSLRAFFSGTGTALLLWQMNDLELERNEPVMRAIYASLQVAED